MSFLDKINEYKDNIEALQAIDSMEVYRWMISLGQRLTEDPLSVNGRLPKNQVSYCQFEPVSYTHLTLPTNREV